jgi:homoserine O-acetyltransferase
VTRAFHVSPATRYLDLPGPFACESGGSLPAVRVAYRTWGVLAPGGDNAVLVCHALTGSADADAWWAPLFGTGRAIDPDRDFVVCANLLGSCYGTTGPASDRGDGVPWGPDFPLVTVRDMVAVQAMLLDRLGVRRVRVVLGGSLGGMLVLEWALTHSSLIETAVPIATSARHSAWCIGWSEAQRQALRADPRWRDGRYPPDDPPDAGLAAARMVAMCTYRSHASFDERHGRRLQAETGRTLTRGAAPDLFAVESYLRYQGAKLADRFDANAYVTLTRAMDSHDVGLGRGGIEAALAAIAQPALVVSIESDVLYPPAEQEELARLMPGARLATLPSPHGHDGFLIDMDETSRMIVEFRRETGTMR